MATLTKDAIFNMRMNQQERSEPEALYGSSEMTLPEAVNVFFENSLLVRGLPLSLFDFPATIVRRRMPFRKHGKSCLVNGKPNLTALPGSCFRNWMLTDARTEDNHKI